jgi:alpha-1,4-digalacturonate transport system permease protein
MAAAAPAGFSLARFLTRTAGRRDGSGGIGITDLLAYAYLALGVLVILLPVLWTVVSSFKPREQIEVFDTRVLPYQQLTEQIGGRNRPLYRWDDPATDNGAVLVFKRGPTRAITEVSRVDRPDQVLRAPRAALIPAERMRLATENYLAPILGSGDARQFTFVRYLTNTVFVTVVATLITLLINSMAAFALSKYRFRGQMTFTLLIIATLLIPSTIILVSLFFVVWSLGMFGSLWGVIIPAAATPTGVFLLRQYMLTIPDELLEAARMDAASEWKIYWRIVLPLSLPALSVLAILSVIWRWNDFLWPLIVLVSDPRNHTLQIGLTSFTGEFNTAHNFILAMTVVSLLPVTLVFVWLQRFITTGIATTGLK